MRVIDNELEPGVYVRITNPLPEITISGTCTYLTWREVMRIFGTTNNYLRLHGGKALRKVPKRYQEMRKLTMEV
jgi:hypothetical protein